MTFYNKLAASLKLSEKEKELLPRSYQLLGKILIIRLKPQLMKHKKLIGEKILELLPYVHTVVLEKGIEGLYRKPKVEIIAGCRDSTQTIHKEHGCQFLLDVSNIMWSKGNKNERERIYKLVKPKETVVDMFSGVGYWSIFAAKKAKKVYAIDINPKAIEYLRKNIWLNNVENKVEILEGDCRKFAGLLENVADRIILGYLNNSEKFLPYAIKISKSKSIIHFHKTAKPYEVDKLKRKIIEIGNKENSKIKILKVKRIKSFSPKTYHFVFDLRLEKNG